MLRYCPALFHHALRTFLELGSVFSQQLGRGSFDLLFEFVNFPLKIFDYLFGWHLEYELELLACGFMVFDVGMQKRTFAPNAVSKRLVNVPTILPFSFGRLANGGNFGKIYPFLSPGPLF